VSEAETFFIAEVMRHARTLPVQRAVTFLDGMLESVGDQHPARARLVAARNHFNDGDAQLELIATGQLKMEALLQS
jgi:hypothetical protein